eukprot:2272750-Amphidinium_carterae.1
MPPTPPTGLLSLVQTIFVLGPTKIVRPKDVSSALDILVFLYAVAHDALVFDSDVGAIAMKEQRNHFTKTSPQTNIIADIALPALEQCWLLPRGDKVALLSGGGLIRAGSPVDPEHLDAEVPAKPVFAGDVSLCNWHNVGVLFWEELIHSHGLEGVLLAIPPLLKTFEISVVIISLGCRLKPLRAIPCDLE